MGLKIVRNDITKMETEAIVNTANEAVGYGSGCDKAVYEAAGREELLNFRREKIGEKKQGEVFITPGFNLKAKYIIHAVSPIFENMGNREEKLLKGCYRKSLELAKKNGIKSIAFPLISTGSFKCPKSVGLRIAVEEINSFLKNNDMEVYVVVFDNKATELGKSFSADLKSFIDDNYVEDKLAEERFADERHDVIRRVNRLNYGVPNFGIFDDEECENETFTGREQANRKLGSRKPDVKGTVNKKNSNNKQLMDMKFDVSECCAPFMNIVTSGEDDLAPPCYNESSLFEPDTYEYINKQLKKRVAHLKDTFSEYLIFLIKEKGMATKEVYSNACVDRKLFSKIKNDKYYQPKKTTALCLCVGLQLNIDETKDLLARAGYAFSPCNLTDLIFEYFIENEVYDITYIDIALEEYGQPCIINTEGDFQ